MKKGFNLTELVLAVALFLLLSLILIKVFYLCRSGLAAEQNKIGIELKQATITKDNISPETNNEHQQLTGAGDETIKFKYSGYKLLSSLVADLNKLQQWQLEKCVVVAKNENAVGLYDWYLLYPETKEEK